MRIFHWALAGLVVFSYVTAKVGGEWMEWHMRSGYSILALLAFRIAWGFVGSDTARFAAFVRGPRAALGYARALRAPGKTRGIGHNPLGGWMVLAMLAILLVQAVTGLFVDDAIATRGPLTVKVSNATAERMGSIHSFNEWLVVGAVVMHVAAIAAYHWLLRANLVGPMFHGRAPVPAGTPAPRIRSMLLATALLALAAAVVYWLVAILPRPPG